MTLTREFKETLQARIERDPVCREELLKEGIESLLAGEVETGKASFSSARVRVIQAGNIRTGVSAA